MSIVAIDFLKTAETLFSAGETEADYRSVASRAYYAALHEANATVPESHAPSDLQLRSKSSHESIIGALQVWGNSLTAGREQARHASRELSKLKRTRIEADYDLHGEFNQAMADEALSFARQIFRRMNEAKNRLNA